MPVAAAPIPVLDDDERTDLMKIIRKRTSPQRLVERARIVMLANEGRNIAETARQLQLTENTVRTWRTRWTQMRDASVTERLTDRPRMGAPARITAQQICQIVAMACEPPSKYDRPITHWTQQELADEAVRQGIVDSISQRSVGRFLKSGRFAATPETLLADQEKR